MSNLYKERREARPEGIELHEPIEAYAIQNAGRRSSTDLSFNKSSRMSPTDNVNHHPVYTTNGSSHSSLSADRSRPSSPAANESSHTSHSDNESDCTIHSANGTSCLSPFSDEIIQISPPSNISSRSSRFTDISRDINLEMLSCSTKLDKDAKELGTYLRLYFYAAFKWKNRVCSYHLVYCVIFLIQIIKVSLLTVQMFDFGHDRANFSSVVNRGHVTLRHLLLKNWDASWETLPYPPAHGVFAVYTIEDWESEINFAVKRYHSADTDATGYYKMLPGDRMYATVKYFDFHGFDDAFVNDKSTKSPVDTIHSTDKLVQSSSRMLPLDDSADMANDYARKTDISISSTNRELPNTTENYIQSTGIWISFTEKNINVTDGPFQSTDMSGIFTDETTNASGGLTEATGTSLRHTKPIAQSTDVYSHTNGRLDQTTHDMSHSIGNLEIHDRTISLGINEGLGDSGDFSISKVFEYHNISQPFKRMLSVSLHFTMHSVRSHVENRLATCLRIEGWINFSDLDNNGQVTVDLITKTMRIKCQSMNLTLSDWRMGNNLQNVGGALIGFCSISLTMTVLTLAFAAFVFVKTKKFMEKYFKEYYGDCAGDKTDLPRSEYFRFLRPWDLATLASDILTVYATAWIVFETEETNWLLETVDGYCTCLGIGCVMAWLSLLRYFKFHTKFHLLFKTFYRAFWDVIAYLICVTVLFVGFWVCGFVVMGPYHVKFETPSAAAETLFSILNGDEVFATLAILEKTKSGGSWVTWFSRFYIGAYVGIFVIVAMNLLITLFMGAYETIKEQLKENREEKNNQTTEENIYTLLCSMQYKLTKTYIENLMKANPNTISEDEKRFTEYFGTRVRFSENMKRLIFVRPLELKALMEDSESSSLMLGLCLGKAADH